MYIIRHVAVTPGSIGVVVSLFTKRFENEWELQVCCSCTCVKVTTHIKQTMLDEGYTSSATTAWKVMINCSNELIQIKVNDACAGMDTVEVSAEKLYALVMRKDEFPQLNYSKIMRTKSEDSSVLVVGRHLKSHFGKEEEIASYHWTVRRPSDIESPNAAKPRNGNPSVESEVVDTSASGTVVCAAYGCSKRQPTSEEITTFDRDRFQLRLSRQQVHENDLQSQSRVLEPRHKFLDRPCLVDAAPLLNRSFKREKASTERAVVAMTHSHCSLNIDQIIAPLVYRMYQLTAVAEVPRTYAASESSHVVKQQLALEYNLKAVSIKAKTFAANYMQLQTCRQSEQDLQRSTGIRDIWKNGISKLSYKAKSSYRSSRGEVIGVSSVIERGKPPFVRIQLNSFVWSMVYWIFARGSHRVILDSDKEKFPDSASFEQWLTERGEMLEQSSRHEVLIISNWYDTIKNTSSRAVATQSQAEAKSRELAITLQIF